jgi:hypothetical protein
VDFVHTGLLLSGLCNSGDRKKAIGIKLNCNVLSQLLLTAWVVLRREVFEEVDHGCVESFEVVFCFFFVTP